MDPAAYARAYGIQSEANRVTVTRVAGNEITYRRAVESYRRRMASTMTHIQREQKKLKRSIKDYKKRLHESLDKPLKKPYKAGWIACDSDTDFSNLQLTRGYRGSWNSRSERPIGYNVMSRHANKGTKTGDNHKYEKESQLQNQVDMFLKSVDDHVNNAHVKKQDVDESKTGKEILFDGKGRRRFLFGRGELGTEDASKDLDSDTEDHNNLLPDSSEDEDENATDTTRNAQSSPVTKPLRELVRLGSVYLKAIDKKDEKCDISSEDTPAETISQDIVRDSVCEKKNDAKDEGQVGLQDQDETISQSSSALSKKSQDDFGKQLRDLPPNETHSSQTVDRVRGDNSSEQSSKTQPSGPRRGSLRKTSNTVNFGELMKFKHGLNTKKLFSMVDQLASKYGVLAKDEKTVVNKNVKVWGQVNEQRKSEPNHQTETKTSFFYAMKYGYGNPQDLADSENTISNRSEIALSLSVKQIAANTLETLREDETQGPDGNGDSQHDSTDSPAKTGGKSRKTELPHLKNSDSLKHRSGQSTISDNHYESDTIKSNGFSHSPMAGKSRSLYDSSKYMSELRRQSVMQDQDKRWFGHENSPNKFDPETSRVNRRKKAVSEHQRKAEDRKIAWSSALGRMKLIHTLVDLTRFI